jgi:prefoldin beta subunit
MDEEFQKRIQNLQALEQDFQQIVAQKQQFQLQLNESKTALEEIEKTKKDVFQVLGNIMVKADQKKLKSDLLEKSKILESRIASIEKQEVTLRENIERIRNEVMDKMQ